MAKTKKEDDKNVQDVNIQEEKKQARTKKEKPDKAQELETQLAEKCDQLLRLAAEYDNFRKRSKKEKEDIYCHSKASIVKDLLPVIDNFERAKGVEVSSLEEYQKGIEMIYTQFLDFIKKIGVETFGEPGEQFDPNLHEAVMHTEDENLGENVISMVISKGYKLDDRIIRSATVTVAN